MNDRIKEIIEKSGLKKVEFAEKSRFISHISLRLYPAKESQVID